MFGFIAKVAQVASSPIGRAVGSAVGKKVFKRSNIARVVKEGRDVLASIDYLANKYGDADDDTCKAIKELKEFKQALQDVF